MNAGAGERTLHPLKGALVDLRNAAFIRLPDSANFFHCQITIVIQRDDLLIPLHKIVNPRTADVGDCEK